MDGEIAVDELRELLDSDESGDGDPRIIDIRNSGAYEQGHVPGSENIPAPELTDRVEELDGAGHVVTVCPHGKASVQAARLVGSYEAVDGPVESLHGGLEAWDGPLEAPEPDGESSDESTAPF